MLHTLVYNGHSFRDFGAVVSGEDSWRKPKPSMSHQSVPGRSGDLLIDNGRYENVELKYRVGIPRNFDENFDGLMGILLSEPGYHRLEDSYHPEVYRLAVMENEVKPVLSQGNVSGEFEIIFSAKPQSFLKSGEQKQVFTEDGEIENPTRYEAKPIVRVYGTGVLSIGHETMTITEADEYTDIDCGIEEAYKDSAVNNCNSKIKRTSGAFFVLSPGTNGVSLGQGITKVEITPGWWTI